MNWADGDGDEWALVVLWVFGGQASLGRQTLDDKRASGVVIDMARLVHVATAAFYMFACMLMNR